LTHSAVSALIYQQASRNDRPLGLTLQLGGGGDAAPPRERAPNTKLHEDDQDGFCCMAVRNFDAENSLNTMTSPHSEFISGTINQLFDKLLLARPDFSKGGDDVNELRYVLPLRYGFADEQKNAKRAKLEASIDDEYILVAR